jgi:predicted LPLAT superfamily acyltransferase
VKAKWMERPEGGSTFGLRLIRGFALLCGRTAARVLLYPITLYYLIRRGPERRASREYLTRMFGRPPSWFQVAKHFHTFAATILDRVFLLSERFKRFDVRHQGLDDLRNAWKQDHGVLVFGSHLGSFDALRTFAQLREDVKIRVVIDVEQNQALFSVLSVLNPALAKTIINARQDGAITALAIKEALDEKALVTVLVDRSRPDNQTVEVDFLGGKAAFPVSPWMLASALKVPVVLCFGLYRGGNRYDFYFELFSESLVIQRGRREAAVKEIVQRYADRLAHHARMAPYNWFNFYDFWHTHDSLAPHATPTPDAGAGRDAGVDPRG